MDASPIVFGSIQTYLKTIGYPVLLVLGITGNLFNVLVFRQQRRSPCAIYLLAFSVSNSVLIIVNSMSQMFPTDFNNGSTWALIVCKIYSYVPIVIGQTNSTMLILACIDRYVTTSSRAAFRALSTTKRAKYLIVFFVLFWSVTTVHSPITASLVMGQCSVLFNSLVDTVYALVFVSLLPCSLLAVFSSLTYRNVRSVRRRVQPIEHPAKELPGTLPRRDRNLLVLVISELIAYMVTSSPFPMIQLEMLITQRTMPYKTGQHMQIEYFLMSISLFLLSVNGTLPFYIYMTVSRTFRADVRRISLSMYQTLVSR